MQMATFVTIVRRGRGRRVVLHYRVMPQRGEERAEVHALGEEVRDDDVYRLPLCGCALCRARRDRRARFLAWTTSFRVSALYISVTTTFSLAARRATSPFAKI